MNERDDLLDDPLQQGLAEANRYDPEALADHLPERASELMLREITATRRHRSLLFGLFPAPLGDQPAFGRAAFVGVLAAVAVAVVGLNVGLSRTNEAEVVEPAGSTPAPREAADGSAPLVVDPAPTSSAPNADGSTATPDDADPEADSDQDPGTADAEAAGEGEASEDSIVPPASVADSGCVSIEIEDFELAGSWRLGYDSRVSGGTFVTWEGLAPEAENTVPVDVIELPFTIDTPGTYRFVWAMRQPFEFGDESADSSWVNVPDAARFGSIDGGSYGGFVPIFGRARGEFDWSATADVDGAQSEVSIVFDAAGVYTMQLAGRSHGHEIDRIVLFHDGLDRDAAIAGSCAGT